MIEDRRCKQCGKILADDNPTKFCVVCRHKGYDDTYIVYHPGDSELGLRAEQVRRHFREYEKKGYMALPVGWRKRGIKVWKTGRWCCTFGATEQEIETFVLIVRIINEAIGFTSDEIISKKIDEAIVTFGFNFFVELAEKFGHDVEPFLSKVRVGEGLPENRRMTTEQLRRAVKRCLNENPQLVEKWNNYKTILAGIFNTVNDTQ